MMAPNDKCEQDGKFIIDVLREGLDYSKLGAAMIALLQLVENHCQAKSWHQAKECCEELARLARDPNLQAVSELSAEYALGVAHMCQGAIELNQDHLGCAQLDSAIQSFSRSQQSFNRANVARSEGVALLAQGIVYQRQYELGCAYPREPFWSQILQALQRSLIIFRDLGDRRYADVRKRLAQVQEMLQQDLDNRQGSAIFAPKASAKPAKGRGTPIPIVGRIPAGEPVLAEQYIEDYIVIDDELAENVTFALRVAGDSLKEAGILNDDLILMQKIEDPPANGRIAAVIVAQVDNEAILKRFYKERDHIRLEPANASYPFIILTQPGTLSEETIRGRYSRSHPKRLLEVYSAGDPLIVGWARALIRKEVK
jgi:SOS-response transcriptional repressor LexA